MLFLTYSFAFIAIANILFAKLVKYNVEKNRIPVVNFIHFRNECQYKLVGPLNILGIYKGKYEVWGRDFGKNSEENDGD